MDHRRYGCHGFYGPIEVPPIAADGKPLEPVAYVHDGHGSPSEVSDVR
jgi:hypothetical protein